MAEDIRKMANTQGVAEFEAQYEAPYCVVLDSEYCSMGRMIGHLACQKAGYAYYDAVILLDELKDPVATVELYDEFEKKMRQADLSVEDIVNDPTYQLLMDAFDRAIDMVLPKGPCLIHDRIAKEAVLKKGYTCTSALTYGFDMDAKIVRAKLSPFYAHLTDDDVIIEKIKEEDNIRKNWHKAAYETVWGDKATYDILINIDTFGRDYSAELLSRVMKIK